MRDVRKIHKSRRSGRGQVLLKRTKSQKRKKMLQEKTMQVRRPRQIQQ
jgi:hypothetical protein